MEASASEKMLQAVKNAKENAARAEQDYDFGASLLQSKAGGSINLFGGSAVQQVADIAADARKLCDSLYASYQTLVKMLDEECRPLLQQQPEISAVRAVRDTIRWLNQESEIENNFTASLNSRSLGGVASGRYFPSIENKMIQSFWESKYHMWPGREEAEQAQRQQMQQQAQKRRQEAEEKCRAEEASYEVKYAKWKKKADEVESRRQSELETSLRNAELAHVQEIEAACAQTLESAEREIASFEKQKAEAEQALLTLGVFKLAEKKNAKKTIERMTANIAAAELRKEQAQQTLQLERSELDSWREETKKQLISELERTYPMPPNRPLKPGEKVLTQAQIADNALKQTIWQGMEPGRLYLLTELMEAIPEISDFSYQRVAALLRQMKQEGTLICTEEKRKAYFQASGK